jgi:hypothetical protein
MGLQKQGVVNGFTQVVIALVEESKIAAPEVERGSGDTGRN